MVFPMRPLGLTLDDAPMPDRLDGGGEGSCLPQSDAATHARHLRGLVDRYYEFVWRSLRRLGVAVGDVDDGVQSVFLTASRKLASIQSGSEKSFLFQTALRVAADSRRTVRRRREIPVEASPSLASRPDAEELVDLRRAWAELDAILEGMPLELRAVFVLFELDEMTTPEIAALLALPVGTAASRLRRARADFRARVTRMRATGLSAKGTLR